ncbi:riboflavin biosynthesis protein RibF [Candidatus Epulonipiscioides gigas]|nr:riboflavin biosynthesis protein RibF [Epulopiscium sp. SCG-C07WGA-EpuloA2]
MKYISHTKKIIIQKNSVVVIGNFDGVHLGHQKLFETANKNRGNLQVLALSFYPHPTWVLNNEQKAIITPTKDKIKIIENFRVDIFIDYPFTLELANMNAYEFFTRILIQDLKAKIIVVGEDYRFGKNRQAGTNELRIMCQQHSIKLYVIEKFELDNETISSTKIRQYLIEGNLEKVNNLLGYTYQITGEVIKGQQIGRTIGFKTANISTKPGVIYPKNGVYATKVKVYNKEFLAITNIGYNPTVDGKVKVIESNIFNFNQDIYNQEIEVNFFTFIRSEKKFSSLNELKIQITIDKEKTISYFTTFFGCDILIK